MTTREMTAPDTRESASAAPADPKAVPWHTLSAQAVAERLEVDPQQGLSPAEVEARRERYGANKLEDKGPTPPWRIYIEQFKSVIIWLLLGASVLASATSAMRW